MIAIGDMEGKLLGAAERGLASAAPCHVMHDTASTNQTLISTDRHNCGGESEPRHRLAECEPLVKSSLPFVSVRLRLCRLIQVVSARLARGLAKATVKNDTNGH
jgi:hypothetical protein